VKTQEQLLNHVNQGHCIMYETATTTPSLVLDDTTMPIKHPKPQVDYLEKEVVKRVPVKNTGRKKMGKRRAPEKPFLKGPEVLGRIKTRMEKHIKIIEDL
jgi:hypothetical protein